MSDRPLHGNRPIPCAAPVDGASPAGDYLDGEVAARIFLSAVDRRVAGSDALAVALRDLLADRGRAIPPSHYLRGFCRAIQKRLERGAADA